MDAVGKGYDLPNFHAKIDSTSTKKIVSNIILETILPR